MAEAGNAEYPTTLGPDATFKGELSFDKGLRLQGKFEGKISSGGRLLIAKEARMQADVDASTVIVEGDVKGNLTANERIELKSSARYEGDLRASKLTVDEGAVFQGQVSVGPEAVKSKPHQPSMGRANVTMGPGVSAPPPAAAVK
jgi:cytoskeletal protein CcmA (bactofilin family)